MKRLLILLLIFSIISLSSCSSEIIIPSIKNVDETTAKQLLLDKNLIPAVVYQKDDNVIKGAVISTDPAIGTTVLKDTVVTLYISEGKQLYVPDVTGLDESTAKTILATNGLIPLVEYQYGDYDKDTVMYTEPYANKTVEPNQQVKLFVSKGPAFIESSDSRISWWNLSDMDDDWNFYSPFIEYDVLYIHCYDVVLFADIEWKDEYNYGHMIGEAVVNDIYDKVVPIKANYQKQTWESGEHQDFLLEIPLGDLDIDKPTSMEIELYAYVNGENRHIKLNFSISW